MDNYQLKRKQKRKQELLNERAPTNTSNPASTTPNNKGELQLVEPTNYSNGMPRRDGMNGMNYNYDPSARGRFDMPFGAARGGSNSGGGNSGGQGGGNGGGGGGGSNAARGGRGGGRGGRGGSARSQDSGGSSGGRSGSAGSSEAREQGGSINFADDRTEQDGAYWYGYSGYPMPYYYDPYMYTRSYATYPIQDYEYPEQEQQQQGQQRQQRSSQQGQQQEQNFSEKETEPMTAIVNNAAVPPVAPYGFGMGFPGMGFGVGGCNDRHSGLDGKDAAFLGSHFNGISEQFNTAGQCDLMDAIRDEGRHTNDTIHSTSRSTELAVEKSAAANALAITRAELTLAKELLKESCATRELISKEHCETRGLIRQVESDRIRDDLNVTRDELFALKARLNGPCVCTTPAV